MHGIVLRQFKEFLVARGPSTIWLDIAHRRDWANPLNPSVHKVYDHHEFLATVEVAAEVCQRDREALLEDFGVHMAHYFHEAYRHLIRSEWSFEEFLLNTEVFMHGQIRFSDMGANPPKLEMTATTATEIELVYRSPLHLCSFAKGIILGFAELFGRLVSLQEQDCMRHGAPQCRIIVHCSPQKA